MELLHFSMAEAMDELRERIERSFVERRFGTRAAVEPWPYDADDLWARLRGRPGMFLGGNSGWHLHSYLLGMERGGDWLGLPEMPRLRDILRSIAARSTESYGSDFAAYRVYDAGTLLEWAGIEPWAPR